MGKRDLTRVASLAALLCGCASGAPPGEAAEAAARPIGEASERVRDALGIVEWQALHVDGDGVFRGVDPTGTPIVEVRVRAEGNALHLQAVDEHGEVGDLVVDGDGTLVVDTLPALEMGPELALLAEDIGSVAVSSGQEISYTIYPACAGKEGEFIFYCGLAVGVCLAAPINIFGCIAAAGRCTMATAAFADCENAERARKAECPGSGSGGGGPETPQLELPPP
jgi:hypothetical protein